MSAYQQLNQALNEREKREAKFYFDLMDEIYKIIDALQPCDTSNSSPEVADSVNLSIQELQNLIAKIKDDSNIDANVSDGIAEEFDRKSKQFHLSKVAPVVPAPSLWNRMFGSRQAPAAPAAAPQSLMDRILGRRPVNLADRERWEEYARHPNNIPNATPVYQAEYDVPYAQVAPNPYGKGGTRRKRKVRKSRRRV
jgi:hypothetical protein